MAFPDNQMQILPYNRTVKDLAGRSSTQFLSRRCAERFPVRDGDRLRRAQGRGRDVSRRRVVRARPGGRRPEDGSRASGLDVALLQHHVLEPLLKIGDIRTDKRIDFVGGARGTAALEQAVDSGRRRSPSRCSP